MTNVEKMMASLQPENSDLADIIRRYDRVDSAYRAILEAIGSEKADPRFTTTTSSTDAVLGDQYHG